MMVLFRFRVSANGAHRPSVGLRRLLFLLHEVYVVLKKQGKGGYTVTYDVTGR